MWWLGRKRREQENNEVVGDKNPKAFTTSESMARTQQPQKVVSKVPDANRQYMVATFRVIFVTPPSLTFYQ